MARPTRVSRALSQNFLADRAAAERFARLAVPQDARPRCCSKSAPERRVDRSARPALPASCSPTRSTRGSSPSLRARFSAHPPSPRRRRGLPRRATRRARPSRSPGTCPSPGPPPSSTGACGLPPSPTPTLLTQLEYARKRTGDYGSWTPADGPDLAPPRVAAGRPGRPAQLPARRRAWTRGSLRIERRRTPLLDAAAYASWRCLVELGFSGVGGSLHASCGGPTRGGGWTPRSGPPASNPGVLVGEVTPGRWLRLHEALAP